LNKTVDLDFNARRRNEVFAYLYAKYKDGFAHIGTHGTLQAKNAFKDVCRIFNVPFLDANSLSSLIPDTAESITEAMLDEKFAKRVNADPILQDVIKYSKALEGTVKSYGVHASFGYEAKLQTKNGPVSIGSLENQVVEILTPNGWKDAKITKTGHKEIIKYKISNSKYSNKKNFLHVTSNHSILTREFNWLEAKDFNGISLARKFADFRPLDFLAGWFWNDGYFNQSKKHGYVFFTPDKDHEVLNYLSLHFNFKQISDTQFEIEDTVLSQIIEKFGNEAVGLNKLKLPPSKNLDIESLRGWLSGMFSSNASIQKGFIVLNLTSKSVIDFCISSLSIFGIEKSYVQVIKGKRIEFSNGCYDCRDSWEFGIGRYDSFKFLNLIGLYQYYKIDKILDMSLWDTFRTERYTGDVFDFEIFTDLENERMAYVDGVISHNCVAHNTKIRTDSGIKTIAEVYNMTNGEGENLPPTLPVCTTYGLMHSRIVKTGKKKGYSVSLFSGDDNREISNLIVSADHRIWVGREGYLKYSSMKVGTKYYYTAKTYSPWFVTDLFIAGFLLTMISKNVSDNNYTMTRDSFGFKLEDMWEIFRDLYADGYASFDRAWGKTHRVSSLTQLAKRIYGLTKLENISYSIVKSYGVDELFYKNLFEQQDFIHGMFSSLQAYREVSISTPTTISISNINNLSSQDFTISNQSGYSSPQIVNIGGIKEHLNDHLRQFDIQLGNILFLDDVNFCRYIAYNPIFLGGVRPPDVYVMKMGLYGSVPIDMYDVQVITFEDSRQNFIANGIHVHNCSAFETPLITREGMIPIGELDGSVLEIFTPDGWKNAKIWKSGEKRVSTYRLGDPRYGEKIRFTSDHLIQSSNMEWITLEEASNSNARCISRTYLTYSPLDFLAGWIWNDGYINNNCQIVSCFTPGKDNEVFEYVNLHFSNREEKKRIDKRVFTDQDISTLIFDKYGEQNVRSLNKVKLPPVNLNMDLESLRSWLSGMFSANSSVIRNNILLILVSKDVIEFVRDSLSRFGINSSNIYSRKSKKVEFSNGEYTCREQFVLTLNSVNSFKFKNLIGLFQTYKSNRITSSGVYHVSDSDVLEPVYEFSILGETNRDNQCGYINGHVFSNCGIVLSPAPLNESIPLYAQDGLPVTMYDGGTCEKLGFVKIDLLGVKVLAIIDETLRFINENKRHQKIGSIYELPLDDAKTYTMLATGDVSG
jgi:hypothetical protein